MLVGIVGAVLALNCIDQTDIGQTRRPNRVRDTDNIKRIVVHKFGPEVDGEAITDVSVARKAFARRGMWRAGSYTAGKMAYHFLYDFNTGTIYQALPLDRVGVHAIGFNWDSVGVALIASRGESQVCSPDWQSFYDFLAQLRVGIMHDNGNFVHIHGHMELPGASRDPFKDCPGHGINLRQLRQTVYYRSAWVDHSLACYERKKQ